MESIVDLDSLNLELFELSVLKERYKKLKKLRSRDCPYNKAQVRKVCKELIEYLEVRSQ